MASPSSPPSAIPHGFHLANLARLKVSSSPTFPFTSPYLSSFNVSCSILYLTTTDEKQWKTACNSEPCSLPGSICAERAALSGLYPETDVKEILEVYIVSDSPVPITPGMLCREYMSSRFPPSVLNPSTLPVNLAGTKGPEVDPKTVISMNLIDLYPAITIYKDPSLSHLYNSTFTEHTTPLPTSIHPSESYHSIKYAAGVMLSNGEVITALQVTGLEYGTTLDCVGQLAPTLNPLLSTGVKIIKVIVVDNLGVSHTPFAVGRAYLSELKGQEEAVCYYTWKNEGGEYVMKGITMKDLCPGLPAFETSDLT